MWLSSLIGFGLGSAGTARSNRFYAPAMSAESAETQTSAVRRPRTRTPEGRVTTPQSDARSVIVAPDVAEDSWSERTRHEAVGRKAVNRKPVNQEPVNRSSAWPARSPRSW
jgi:hypothetical protein